jgi:predicted HTH transcriptional regulator
MQQVAQAREHQHVEWKESWRDEYQKWICGFANADGGTLVIGRDDRGKVVGVEDAARLLVEIPNKVRDILGIMVDVNLFEESGKEFVQIGVEAYPNPVSYKGEYYYRSGSQPDAQGRSVGSVPVAQTRPHVGQRAVAGANSRRSRRRRPEKISQSGTK